MDRIDRSYHLQVVEEREARLTLEAEATAALEKLTQLAIAEHAARWGE